MIAMVMHPPRPLKGSLRLHSSCQFQQNALLSVLCALLAWGVWLGYYELRFSLNEPPNASGDEIDYDALGWELRHGKGFQIDTGDADFRRPYEIAAETDKRFDPGPPRKGVLTYRPPLFPLIIAGTDWAFGRQFWAVRVFNSGCLAISGGLLIWLLLERRGIGPAILGLLLFVFVDQRTRLYGRTILTEPISVLLITILLLLLLEQSKRRHLIWPVCSGIVFGLAILARSLFILWLPGLILIITGISVMGTSVRRYRTGLIDGMIFTVTTLLVLSPWAVRNCQVLDRFMPMGTQGTAQLAAAFSDTAWDEGGHWINLEQRGFFDPVLHENMTILEHEKAMADYSSQQTKHWILKNPGKSLGLVPMKIGQELLPRTPGEWIVLMLAIPGIFVGRNDILTRLGLALFAVNASAIGMTWSVEGRFLVPLLVVIHYWSAIGGWWLLMSAAGATGRLAASAGWVERFSETQRL